LFVGMTGARSLSIGRDSWEVRRQRHPGDEAVVVVIDRDPCATTSRMTRKPEARRRSGARKRADAGEPRWPEGATWGKGVQPTARAAAVAPTRAGCAPGGSHRSLVSPDTRGRPTDRQSDGGQQCPAPRAARGQVGQSSTAQTKAEPMPGMRPAGQSEQLARAQRGAPAVET